MLFIFHLFNDTILRPFQPIFNSQPAVLCTQLQYSALNGENTRPGHVTAYSVRMQCCVHNFNTVH
jgi:hypothetical protein